LLLSDLSRPNEATLLSPAADVIRDSELLSVLMVCAAAAAHDDRHNPCVIVRQLLESALARHHIALLGRSLGEASSHAEFINT